MFALIVWWVLAVPAGANGVASEPLPESGLVLIDFGDSWRYHDGNEDLGDAWRGLNYDDSRWATGPALLGYDTANRRGNWPEPGLRTELTPNLLTYYFRASFEYDGPLEGVVLRLDQIIDDGAVYFLNGVEIGRSALMPEGDVGFGTRTTSWTNPSIETDAIEADGSLLRRGRNVLAVSVHNQSANSSDICLGVRLRAVEAEVPPRAMYLTWRRDPTTTMVVQWHGEPGDAMPSLAYRARGAESWRTARPEVQPMAYTGRPVYTAELTGLEPGSKHEFRIVHAGDRGRSGVYLFRTMPAEAERPIRLAIGGDVRHRQSWMERTNRQAVRFDPDLIVWGGDLAYADGREDRLDRWDEFFEACMNTLVTESGRVVPIVVGIGNHEVLGGYYWGSQRGREAYEDTDAFRESIAPYFYSMFAFPGHPGYGVLDFGSYLSLFLLDTDHSGPVEGTQTEWLAERLAERAGRFTHVIPVYHVPAYPSVRSFTGGTTTRVREHWSPLFEKHGVRVAFENHDHAYKRTVPIRAGEPHEGGVVYIGDGAWGVGVRAVHDAAETWYLERSASERHLILLTIAGEHLDLKVINEDGGLIDHTVLPAR
ncbi:MAG: metallophosphoesterase family protein [Phycisphaerales bacterium]|nr:metallophosphoesterase family protein [Phycisphaerales bacterium]